MTQIRKHYSAVDPHEHGNATPGKSIYLDGFVLEGYKPHGVVGGVNMLNATYQYTHKFPCPVQHSFVNGQDVTGLYKKMYQVLYCGTWFNVNDQLYNYEPESTRRIIALPIQADKQEGEKESDNTVVLGLNNGRITFIKTFHYPEDKEEAKKYLSFVQDETKFDGWYISQVGQWRMEHKNDTGATFSISIPNP